MSNIKINFKDVEAPINGRTCYTEYWWICLHGNPTSALFVGDAPQCNRNKAICDRFIKTLYGNQQNLEVVFVPVAYVPRRD